MAEFIIRYDPDKNGSVKQMENIIATRIVTIPDIQITCITVHSGWIIISVSAPFTIIDGGLEDTKTIAPRKEEECQHSKT